LKWFEWIVIRCVIIIEFSLILWLCVIMVFRGYVMFWFVLY